MTIIFVGPDPGSPHIAHAGGQLTATTGFAAFAADQGLEITWIDTAQSNFPVPLARERIIRAGSRLLHFTRSIAAGESLGAILFAGAGPSFIERALMALIARLLGKPSLLMIRSGHFQTQFRRSPVFRALSRLLLKVPPRIGVQGESWVPFLLEAGVDKPRIVVVPNWPARQARAPRVRTLEPGAPLRLLFAGWMTSQKGVPELIAAMRELAGDDPVVNLTMAGGGTLLDEARAAAELPDLRGRLAVRGWLNPDELAPLFEEAHILVLPSHAEGFPNVVLEALAEGLPVIATPVGAVADSVKDGINGSIVPIRNPAALARAIRHYLVDPGQLERHSRNALETAAQRHDRDRNCLALIAALSDPK